MRVSFLIPGRLDAKTGGTIYDKKIVTGLRARGWSVDVVAPDAVESIPDSTVTIVDGLVHKTHADLVKRHATRLPLIALVHLPLALEVGLAAAEANRLRVVERDVLGGVRHVIVTGPAAIGMLDGYDVPRARITVIEPGTDPAPVARGSGSDVVHLLCVGSVTEGKGHAILLRALDRVPSRNWTLLCAGRVVTPIATTDPRVRFAGELSDAQLADAYDRADVFVLATLRETFGMAVAEAIAHGLPVVSTNTGSIADTVGDAGLLVQPADEAALASALERVIADNALRAQLASAARRQRTTLRTWDQAVDEIARVLEAVNRA
jgi:glycosyltransferase involved in cell wall biosynthesis